MPPAQLLHLVNYDAGWHGHLPLRLHLRRPRPADVDDTRSTALWTYEYDATGPVDHAVLDSTDPGIPDQDLTYVYDAAGNRIRTISNGVTTEYTTNNMNQYTAVGGTPTPTTPTAT